MSNKITTVAELERMMKGRTAAMKSVVPVHGDEKFTFLTQRHSPNCSVDPVVAKKFIEKHENKLKIIGWNKTSTTIYVLSSVK